MGTLANLIQNTKDALAARIGAVLVLRKYGTAETSDEVETAVQGPSGGLAVDMSGSALPVGAATEATLAALNAKVTVCDTADVTITASALPTGAATETTLAALNAKVTACNTGAVTVSSCALPTGAATSALQTAQTVRHTTTPSKADAATGQIEVSKVGGTHVNAALRHVRRIPLTSGLATTAASLTEGACDCIRVTAGDVIAYLQGPETALLASQSGADWTGGAGWSRVGNVWSHAAGGGASDLEYTMAGLNVGDTACVIYTMVWTAGTSVTEKLGTGAGSARSSSATFVKLITSAGSAKIIFSATDDAVCDIDVSTVFVIPGSPPLAANTWEPQSAVKVVALAAKATPATADTTTQVWAGWYRRAAGVEVT